MHFLERPKLQALLDALSSLGFTCVGPKLQQDAVVYDHVSSVDELPIGWTDEQAPGRYRLSKTNRDRCFDFVVGPQSWKKFLFPPSVPVMRTRITSDGFQTHSPEVEHPKFAFIGVRACELAAIAIQDRVFISEHYKDPIYAARRNQLFIVSVQCTRSAETCFCASMATGPASEAGFDLALTELDDGFVLQIGSEAGEAVANQLPLRTATEDEVRAATAGWNAAAAQQTRRIDTTDLHRKLLNQLDHPHWSDVAKRCLSCANCTQVCPTCFCSSVDDVTDLVNEEIVRQRRWDSCFNFDFSHISGGPVRGDIRSRYRQWLTHKLGSWVEQFDTSGCVGCGRCITWCPVGIDLTEEVAVLCADSEIAT